MKQFLLAISFLTTIPAYGNRLANDREVAGSLVFYPLVGFLMGALLAGLSYITHLLPLGIGGTALIIVFWIILTGGLHLDGMMDTADGLFSGKERERKLEIMRDSRVGAMGAIALAALLILKFSFLSIIDYPEALWVLMICPAWGRCIMVVAIYFFPYARSGPGLGKLFADQVNLFHVLLAVATFILGVYLLAPASGLILLGITILPMVLIVVWIAGQLGGLTGDTYGAICEISETVLLITFALAKSMIF